MEEPNIKEVAERIRLLREDCDLTMQEMADHSVPSSSKMVSLSAKVTTT